MTIDRERRPEQDGGHARILSAGPGPLQLSPDLQVFVAAGSTPGHQQAQPSQGWSQEDEDSVERPNYGGVQNDDYSVARNPNMYQSTGLRGRAQDFVHPRREGSEDHLNSVAEGQSEEESGRQQQ